MFSPVRLTVLQAAELLAEILNDPRNQRAPIPRLEDFNPYAYRQSLEYRDSFIA